MNKHLLNFIVFVFFAVGHTFGQKVNFLEGENFKSRFYVYWGWNLDMYSTSDIHFEGEQYNFTLQDVVANDRQTAFEWDKYCNPLLATIPQYNFRIGYFINNHYNISFGIDHMKYVMKQRQLVDISGFINNSETPYDGWYNNNEILIAGDFLQFEHTDGLNYINTEFRRMDNLVSIGNVVINGVEGIGTGILLPKTNCTLLNNDRYDEFHLAGFGVDVLGGINVTMYKYFFLQTEIKGGFINMPDIRTTSSVDDVASQHFFFAQWNVVFGVNLHVNP